MSILCYYSISKDFRIWVHHMYVSVLSPSHKSAQECQPESWSFSHQSSSHLALWPGMPLCQLSRPPGPWFLLPGVPPGSSWSFFGSILCNAPLYLLEFQAPFRIISTVRSPYPLMKRSWPQAPTDAQGVDNSPSYPCLYMVWNVILRPKIFFYSTP